MYDVKSILAAIDIANKAVDAGIKIKEKFFDGKSGNKSGNAIALENLQAELEAQNQIIINLSTALRFTAEELKKIKVVAISAVLVSVISISLAAYVLIR